ncbi:uncharacterized protein LOC106643234 isoform X2 [Copidosoma floridanum]|uniref:uncharacterized protein LOC106643234 isoform X2 n=1 Tax=Copidosoma floridanum TaxID=29053 RepID=UPI0006C9BDB9|nr:uncharacterized protein LOC106643234 isoform X2 [Copidosoma floridanum]
MRMNVAASLVLLQTTFLLAGSQYLNNPFAGQRPVSASRQPQQPQPAVAGPGQLFGSKRASTVAEPTCEELRAMWRYSKRQSRAAESTNELPVYRDPFSYNVWEAYPSRSPSYSEDYVARSRSSGAPIYGKIMHKMPAGSRPRNGNDRSKAFENFIKVYGYVNRHPPRNRQTYRVGGGGSVTPQAGSFQHLKELITNERAHELQEQRQAEEMAARAAVLKEMTSGEHRREPLNPNYLDSLQGSYQDPNSYDFAQYTADGPEFGQSLTKSDRYGREYALR